MNRSLLLVLLLATAVTACGGTDPVGPSPAADTADLVPFSADRHVVPALADHFGTPATKIPIIRGTNTPQMSLPRTDYLEMGREVLGSGDVVVTGQFLFFAADQSPQRGTLESVFTLRDGLWQHISSAVQEGPVEAIPLTVRVRTAESSLPLDDVEVLARRQGSQILTSGAIRTDSNGEARLLVLRGVFDLEVTCPPRLFPVLELGYG